MGSAIVKYMRFQKLMPQQEARKMRAILVVLTFKASLCMLAGGGILADVSGVCTRVLLWPMFAIAIFLMVIFICGCIGIRRQQFLLKLFYLLGFFFVILALLVFLVFGYVVVGGIDIRPVKAREYSLTNYRGWLRGRVADPRQYWETISECLRNRHACKAMSQLVRDPGSGMFVPEHSWAKDHDLGDGPMPIESGCCKPPSSCAFTYVNGTTWIPTRGAPKAEASVDCSRWSNDQQKLCFQCDSCKAGFLDQIKKGWSIAAIFPVLTLIALICTCRSQVGAMYND